MKKIILIALIYCPSLLLFGQHSKHPELLKADSTWTKEIIEIPFGFAKEIKHKGYEDIRFAKGWSDKESPQFWSYIFVWNIDLKTPPTVAYLEENLKYYFHGLMTAVNKEKDKTIPETVVVLQKTKDTKQFTFTGKIRTHDSFKTKDLMTLYVHVESHYCPNTKNYLPLFRFSQQPFGESVWKELKSVQLNKNACTN